MMYFFLMIEKFKYTLLHEISRFVRCKLSSKTSPTAAFSHFPRPKPAAWGAQKPAGEPRRKSC